MEGQGATVLQLPATILRLRAFQELDESWVICGLRRKRQVQACQQKPVNRGSDLSLEPQHREAVSAGALPNGPRTRIAETVVR